MIARRALCLLALLISATSASTAASQWQNPPAQPAPLPAVAPPQGAAPAGPMPAAPSPYDPSLQAGGLAPPPPMQNPPAATPSPPSDGTARQLDTAKERDSGRGLELLWLNVEGGFEHVGLSTFNSDEQNLTAGFISTSSSG